jgi:hypothetical protein
MQVLDAGKPDAGSKSCFQLADMVKLIGNNLPTQSLNLTLADPM